jgi:hypothetical protein
MHNIDGTLITMGKSLPTEVEGQHRCLKTMRINFGERCEERALVLIPTPERAQRADKKGRR